MRSVVIVEMRDYAKKYARLVPASAAAVLICFGFLVFSGNIRVDTEELINNPGTTVGWLTIGRFGLALLKSMLGLRTHNVIWSGLLFFVFFLAGANFLAFSIYHFSGKREEYPYWVFLMLYVTSNIWCYQIYFSLQQAEIACAMLFVAAAAFLSVRACFETTGMGRVARLFISGALLVIGLGSYQALAAYYITICIALFFVLVGREDAAGWERRILAGIWMLAAQFAVSYVVYRLIADTWFMAASGYMDDQMGWGRLPAVECIKNVIRTARNYLVGNGPRNFSFYAIGVASAVFVAWLVCRAKREGDPRWQGPRFALLLLALVGIVACPFLMTLYMGEMLVARSQFALPVTAAFLGMCGLGAVQAFAEKTDRPRRMWILWVYRACVVAAIAWQACFCLRLAHTDAVRTRADEEKARLLVEELAAANSGSLPEQPVIFVGCQSVELDGIDRRTEMYGWSFFEWDYSEGNPTGATHRIAGFVQAYTGNVLSEAATEEQREAAVALAEEMCDFPAQGAIAVADDFVVVRLSEVRERPETDWW